MLSSFLYITLTISLEATAQSVISQQNELMEIFSFKKGVKRRRNKRYLRKHEKSVPTIYDCLVKGMDIHILSFESSLRLTFSHTGIF